MLKAGVDKVYRNTLLGHSIQGMDRYYIVPTDKDLSKAMEKYINAMENSGSAQDVVVAINNFTSDMKVLLPKMKKTRR